MPLAKYNKQQRSPLGGKPCQNLQAKALEDYRKVIKNSLPSDKVLWGER